MNKERTTIEEFRLTGDEAILEEYQLRDSGDCKYPYDQNYNRRKDLIFELYKDCTAQDRLLLKWLIKQELSGFEAELPVWTTDIAAFLLFKHMEMTDVYDLYDAKFGAGTDHQCTVDIEFIFGPGREEMKNFLQKENSERSKEILTAIEWYEKNPNAKFRSKEEYIEYFESRKFNTLCADLEDSEY